jgi:hypothetical protein
LILIPSRDKLLFITKGVIMSIPALLFRGFVCGTGSLIATRVLGPYVLEAASSYLSPVASAAGTALKTTALFAGATGLAAGGYGAACYISKKTDLTQDGFDLLINKGWSEAKIERLHKFVPALTFAASCAPLAYLAVRLFV